MSQEMETGHTQEVQKLAYLLQKITDAKEDQIDFFSNRLKRIVDLQIEHEAHLTEEGVALMRFCAYSNVRDLRELGATNIPQLLIPKAKRVVKNRI